MSLLLIDGADDALSTYKWTSGAVRDTPASPGPSGTGWARTGPASLMVGVSSGFGGYPSLTLGVADRHSTVVAGFAFNGHGTFDTDMVVLTGEGGTTHITLARNSTGGFYLKRGATVIATSAPTLWTINTWYYVELKATVDDTLGTATVRLNGVNVIAFSGDTRNGGADALVYAIGFTAGTGAGDRQMSIDDIYLLNGAGSVNNDFLGDCTVQTLYPNGNGALSQFVGSDGNSVDNYLLVDEPEIPNTSDYVESGTPGNIDTYAFSDLAGGTVKGVAHRSYAAKSDTGTRTFRQTARIGGVNYPGSDYGLGTTYLGYSRMMETSPATGVPWTLVELNAAEFGVEART